jgi:hypothetical protein
MPNTSRTEISSVGFSMFSAIVIVHIKAPGKSPQSVKLWNISAGAARAGLNGFSQLGEAL